MILGQDISRYQGTINWDTYKNNSNFVIMKASEGNGYIDSLFGNYRTQARRVGLPLGYYHFARPDLGNTPQAEANFFCSLIDGDPIREGEIMCLDYEVTYSNPVTWCKGWLDAVAEHFNGCKPLIYLNQSTAKNYDWSPVVNAGYGLWIAAYTYDPNKNTFVTGKWPFACMQQWTNQQNVPGITGNVDGNVFFGDITMFKKYGYSIPVSTSPTPPTTPVPPTPPVVVPPQPSEPPEIDYKPYLLEIKTILTGLSKWYSYLGVIKKIKAILNTSGI